MSNKRTNLEAGIFVNVPELVEVCTRANERATLTRDEDIKNASVSVMSALILVLGKRRAYIPEELRDHYNLLMRKV